MKNQEDKSKIREIIFRWLFLAGDVYKAFILWFRNLCRFFFSITLFFFILFFIFFIGFSYSEAASEGLRSAFRISFVILFLTKYLPELMYFKKDRIFSLIFRIIIFLFTSGVLLSNFLLVIDINKIFWKPFYGNTSVMIAVFMIGISEASKLVSLISKVKIPPALIFTLSFLIIIFIGSVLLLLPKAHNGPLSYLDSLFTSVSAVCVTGLIVVDTGTAFTTLGQIILLCLIQIGGLGIMTFTGFFSFIFTSGSTFRDRLLLKEIFSLESLNNLFRLLAKILLITFLTEIAGALLIYGNLDRSMPERVLFSIFHSISGFCNAGFSTMTEGLYSPILRYSFPVHIYVAVLIILGGVGFPVLLKIYSSFKRLLLILFRKIRYKRIPVIPEKRNISTRIVLFMTVILILAGTGLYYIFESGNSLNGINDTQKLIVSFFGSVSSRTAGFNIVDISMWSSPTVFLMIFLMWIGASPGSTGGGIKTTTFALACRSAWNNMRGREQFKIGNREVGNHTITRVLSIIFLSIITIASGFFCLLLAEPSKDPVHLIFEAVSAFSTVGLSLADTSTFSQEGKMVVIFLMFIGRIGPLTLLTGIMFSYHKKYSRYPEADIIIN